MLSACQGEVPVPRHLYHSFQEYQELGHYKAFATTLSFQSGSGYAANHSTINAAIDNAAIDAALRYCQQGNRGYGYRLGDCRLRYLGDEFVLHMNDEELQEAIQRYQQSGVR